MRVSGLNYDFYAVNYDFYAVEYVQMLTSHLGLVE